MRRLTRLIINKNIQRKMLHIGKIDQALFSFLFIKKLYVTKCQPAELLHRPVAKLHLLGDHIGRKHQVVLGDLLYVLLYAVTKLLCALFFLRRYALVLLCRQSVKRNPSNRVIQLIIRLVSRSTPHHLRFFLKQLSVHIRSVGQKSQLMSRAQLILCLKKHSFYRSNTFFYPFKLIKILSLDVVIKRPLLDISLRPRHTHGKAIEPFDILFNSLVVTSRTEIFHAIDKIFVASFFCLSILFLKHSLHNIFLKKPELTFISDTVRRIKPNKIKVIFNNILTKRIYSSYLRIMNKRLLLLQMCVLRILQKLVLNGKSNLLLHLRSCRFGKSNDKKVVNIHPFIYHLYDALDKNSRLSGSGGG